MLLLHIEHYTLHIADYRGETAGARRRTGLAVIGMDKPSRKKIFTGRLGGDWPAEHPRYNMDDVPKHGMAAAITAIAQWEEAAANRKITN
jgi:hypothetical protein